MEEVDQTDDQGADTHPLSLQLQGEITPATEILNHVNHDEGEEEVKLLFPKTPETSTECIWFSPPNTTQICYVYHM